MNTARMFKIMKITTMFVFPFMMCSLLLSFSAFAQSGAGNDNGLYQVESAIMLVNQQQSSIVVAEKVINVVPKTENGSVLTDLRDLNGNPIQFSSFSEGQTVFVQGRIDDKGEIIATSVQMRKTQKEAGNF